MHDNSSPDTTEDFQAIGGEVEGVYEIIVREMEDAVFLVEVEQTDDDYTFTFRRNNASHQQLTGISESELRGQTPQELLGDEQGATVAANYRRCAEKQQTIKYEETLEFPTGTTHWQTNLTPIIDGNQVTQIVGVTREITERKQREQEIRRLKTRLELAVEGASLGVWDWDMTTDKVEFNEQWARMLGHSLDEIEPHHEEWEQRVHPDDLDAVKEALDGHIAGETELYDTEHRMRTADGNWKWTRGIGKIAERDEEGEPVRAVGIVQDITDIKEYEQALENQRDNLEVLNKIVRHDIRNDIQVIVAYAEALEDYVEEGGEEYLQTIADAGREAVEITQTAAEVTEAMLGSETNLTPVNLRSVVKTQMTHVRTNHEGALVSTEGEVPDTTVLADDMLESVFRNVLNNAIVHNDKEVPKVTVSATAGEETVRVRIADNGPGISDEAKDQVFKEGEKSLDSEGTGLGLYLVQTLVDRYGGTVQIENNEPDGSVFIVELRREQ